MAHYVAAKSAVNGLTKALALELGLAGVTVNAVPPGFIDTPMSRRAESRGLLGGTIDDHIQRTPVRRAGRPENIAAACAFLVSEEARNTHGGQVSHGRTHGMGLLAEAIVQLRGEGGPRQVPGARVAVVSSGGLTPSGAILLRTDA